MSERTQDQLMDEVVHAAACVVQHYSSAFNEEGIKWLREVLEPLRLYLDTDTNFRIDVHPGDEFEDFHQRIVWPVDWDVLTFPESV